MDNKKNGIPKLRFPGFTGAWEQRKLGEEFKRVNERNNGEFGKDRWISVAKMYFQDPDKVTSNNIDTRTYVMRFGDIAFEGHPNNEFKFGRFVANDIGDGVVSELFPIYRHIRDYDNNYWKYAIHLERIMGPIFAKSITSSGNSSNKLAPKDLLRQSIFLPHLDEQKEIGNFLKKMDSLITLHQRKLEHLQEQKKGLLQKMFPKNGETVPEVRFPGFTDAWEQRKLGEISELNGRIGFRGYTVKDIVSKEDGGILTFSPTNIINNSLEVKGANTYITKEKYEESPEIKVDNGDILFVKTGSTLGKSALVSELMEPATINPQIVIIRSSKHLIQFLSVQFITNYVQKQITAAKIGGAVPTLTEREIKKFKFYIPNDLDETRKIGQLFSKLDSLITLHQRKLEHLELMKKGLLQQMFV